MIIYNVTLNVEDEIHAQWLNWMKSTHLPEVMGTGCFLSYKMLKLISRQEDETGITYAIQYSCSSLDEYNHYQKTYAPELQAKTNALFNGRFVAFRTILEEVS
jgi:hypothetical protein